jgi:hypothetical protein
MLQKVNEFLAKSLTRRLCLAAFYHEVQTLLVGEQVGTAPTHHDAKRRHAIHHGLLDRFSQTLPNNRFTFISCSIQRLLRLPRNALERILGVASLDLSIDAVSGNGPSMVSSRAKSGLRHATSEQNEHRYNGKAAGSHCLDGTPVKIGKAAFK